MDNEEARERINQKVDEVLESLEPSYADLLAHDCSTHPRITHERWLQCQHECRAILAGYRDPEMEAARRAHETERRRIVWRQARLFAPTVRIDGPHSPVEGTVSKMHRRGLISGEDCAKLHGVPLAVSG
jgi:hypothetical protein